MRSRRSRQQDADLDITSFMNLMIILVPVLLMSMVFSHMSVLNLTLPDLGGDPASQDENENKILELIIQDDQLVVNYPAGVTVRSISKVDGEHDFELLSKVLQQVKRTLEQSDIDKRDILILSQQDTDYQTLVTAMDTVRSFPAVVAASVVEAELFPEISLGDAPITQEGEE